MMQARNCTSHTVLKRGKSCQRETSLSFSRRLCVSSLVKRRERESAKSLIYIAVTHINWLYSCRAFSAQLSSFDAFYSPPCNFIRMHQHVIRFFLSSVYRFLFKIFIAARFIRFHAGKSLFPTSKVFSTRNKKS